MTMNEYALTEDSTLEARLRGNLAEEYSKLREGIHVSDLVLCLRQAAARKLYPIPPTQKQLGYFFDGARRHEALQALYGEGIAERKGTFEGVSYSIDIFDGFPIEFKTTRARAAISEHWLRQLSYYMLATGSDRGIIQVQRIMAREENPFPAFVMTLSLAQKERALAEFRERRDAFAMAIAANDLSLAPILRGDGEWLCRECQYRKRCDEIEGVVRTS